ncbi:MAG: FkbM family methyltransferase, partial [Sphingobium sp.]
WRNLDPTAVTLDRLAALPGLYADDLSRDICAAVTAWRYRRELIDGFPVGKEEDKYNLALLGCAGRHYDLIYDGGPYDLGLLDSLAKSGISWDEVIAFEPDPAHRAVCGTTAQRWTAEGGAPVTIDTRALSNRTGQERFLASGLFSSRLIEDSALDRADLIEVSTCSLDDVHRDRFGAAGEHKRILLKLHVEGAELAVLEGAADLLRDHKVDVLVNLSHDEPSWRDLPAYLAGFGCFDLILRCHALFGEGLTLFARNRA